MGNADDGGIHHRRVIVKRVFDFGRIDVFAAANDDVLGAIDDIAITLRIEPGEIAGADPAALDKRRGGGIGVVPIAFDHHRSAGPKFPDFADGLVDQGVGIDHAQIGHRHGRAATVGAGKVIVADDVGDRRHRFGHAPAVARPRAKHLADLAHQIGCRWGAAIGHHFQRREIVFFAVGMFEQLPGDGRHAASLVDTFAFDQGQRLAGIPAAHEHQLVAGKHRPHQHRAARGDMEQRDRHQAGAGAGRWRHFAPTHERRGGDVGARQDIGDQIAMRAQRAFGVAGGAGRVENRRLDIRVKIGLGQIAIGQCAISVRATDNRFQRDHARQTGRQPHAKHMPERRNFGQQRHDPVKPLRIGNQHRRPRRVQPIGQFRPRPPGIQRHADRTQSGYGKEHHRPFGQIAHRQRNAIARLHPQPAQMLRQCRHGAEPAVERDAFILTDQEFARAMAAPDPRQGGQIRGRVFPRAKRAPMRVDNGHFERRARSA